MKFASALGSEDQRRREREREPGKQASCTAWMGVGDVGSQGRGILSRAARSRTRRVPSAGATYTGVYLRVSRGIRAAAWALVAAGVAAPAVRKRLKLPHAAVIVPSALSPIALCVARPAQPQRATAAVCALNMWGYLAAYEMPNDDPERLAARVHVRYPIAIDRVLGLGVPPTLRLQRAFSRARDGQPLRARARLVPLDVVLRPARQRRLRAAAPPRAVSARAAARCTPCSTSAPCSTGRSRPLRRGGRRFTASSRTASRSTCGG